MADNTRSDADHEAVNSDTFNDNAAYKVAYGITWLGGNVHESITKAAAEQAGMQYTDKLETGIRWNDAPSDNPEKLKYTGLNPLGGDINKPGTMTYRSHKGDLQTLHSMTPVYDTGKVPTNGEVRDNTIAQQVEFFEQARKSGNELYLGKILHTVQDAHVLSHVQRDASGKVIGFQNYNEQDHSAHSQDEMRQIKTVTEVVGIQRQVPQDWQEVPGAFGAVKASADIMRIYQDPNKTSQDLADYLRDKVYPFANEQIKDLPAGGSDPKYQKRIAENAETPMGETNPASQLTSFGQMGASQAAALKIAEHIPEQYHARLQELVNQRIIEHNLTVGLLEKTYTRESPTLPA
ncbi:MAG: hypothetical protein PHD12_10825 [Methylotenera sp.]|nr:hypothetical protein [Methylotenera sp.]